MLSPVRKIADLQTEKQISFIKQHFLKDLSTALQLHQVFAPLFVSAESGINDDLNSIEKPVNFRSGDGGRNFSIVHSLAKWKRLRLAELDIPAYEGIVTHMIALRPDEILSPLHSILVDQWDWEMVITPADRNPAFLEATVRKIYSALCSTLQAMLTAYPGSSRPSLPSEPVFIHAEDLRARYPDKTPKEREDLITREHGAVFLTGIGHVLSDGQAHDGRAPDYDDWSTETAPGLKGLNGDLLLWHPVMQRAIEISSMGIRVDAKALKEQLRIRDVQQREHLPFHQMLLTEALPCTMGGGIGQSRLVMFLLQQEDIASVQYCYS
jgi:aspartate--ammonia ligase